MTKNDIRKSITSKKITDLTSLGTNLTKRGLVLANKLGKDSTLKSIDKGQSEMSLTLAPGVEMVFVRITAGPFLLGISEKKYLQFLVQDSTEITTF